MSVCDVVAAVEREDLAWLGAQAPTSYSRADTQAIMEAFMRHHPPGMYTALYRLGLPLEPAASCEHATNSRRTLLSHPCHGTDFPDYVIEEERDLLVENDVYDAGAAGAGTIVCALWHGNVEHASRIARIYGRGWCNSVAIREVILSFCTRGECASVIERVSMRLLTGQPDRQSYASLGLLICHHVAESTDRLVRYVGGPSQRVWMSLVFSFIHPPVHSPDQDLAMDLWYLYERGAPFCCVERRTPPSDRLDRAVAACQTRSRLLVIATAARHLPVFGIPELVANYAGTQFDHLGQYGRKAGCRHATCSEPISI